VGQVCKPGRLDAKAFDGVTDQRRNGARKEGADHGDAVIATLSCLGRPKDLLQDQVERR
jgi:hypothetical protein